MRRRLLVFLHVAMLAGAVLAGCELHRDPVRRFARADGADGWVVYHEDAWRPAAISGVRPPSYVAEHILRAGNTFIFTGNVARSGEDSVAVELRAWSVVLPIRRWPADSVSVDTTGARLLTLDDFRSVHDYQRFTYTHTSEYWPRRDEIYGASEVFGAAEPDSADTTRAAR